MVIFGFSTATDGLLSHPPKGFDDTPSLSSGALTQPTNMKLQTPRSSLGTLFAN